MEPLTTAVTLWISGALLQALQLDDQSNRQLLDMTVIESRTVGFGQRILISVGKPARLRQWCYGVLDNDTYGSSWKQAAKTTIARLKEMGV